MKFCPTCETRYDEEILRFCTKDGTPLVDENQPNFTEMPSESLKEEDDLGEETMVSYKPRKDLLEPDPQPEIDRSEAPRIVISTNEQKREQAVRPRNIPPYQPLPQKQNTAKVVLLTVLGTLAVLAMVLGLFIFFRNEEPANVNLNINTNPPNTNFNSNLNVGASNFNFNVSTNFNSNLNTNFNVNFNTNLNANIKTPTPTPKPSPSANVNANVGNINTNVATPTPAPPSSTPTPRVSPTPTRTETPTRTPTPSPAGRPSNNSDDN